MTLSDELIGYLQRKRCAMTVGRIAEDFKKPPQVIESNLAVLRREGKVQILRPGEWEIAPERPAAAEVIPPEPSSAVARARPLVPPASTDQPVAGTRAFTPYSRLTPPPKPAAATDNQETDMATQSKVCNECEKRKPTTDFYDKSAKCKPCYNARQAKLKAERNGTSPRRAASEPQGGVAPKPRANGSGRFAEAIGSLRIERDRLISEVSKIDSAIAQLTALG